MSTKFEQLLDYLVNEEMDKANELFHEIVVEKSRTIYENLIAEEDDEMEESMKDDEMDESMDDEMDEGTEELEDSFVMDAEENDGFDDEDDDATGMLGQEIGADDDMGDEMDGAEDDEEQAMFDIKNAIEELEAAFAELEAAQGGEMGEVYFRDVPGSPIPYPRSAHFNNGWDLVDGDGWHRYRYARPITLRGMHLPSDEGFVGNSEYLSSARSSRW